jgi:hypothetical protein
MHAGVVGQRVNVGKERIKEMVAETGLLMLLEGESLGQIRDGGRKDRYFHCRGWRSSFLASAQST